MALGMPLLISVVPSTGSTAKSQSGPSPLPTSSPLYSIGALSFSPSPITTTPRIDTEFTSSRIASTAARSPPSLSPRPTQRPAAIAPASVTRTSSSARWRAGASRRRMGDAALASGSDSDEPLARRAPDSDEPLARRAPDSDEPLARRAPDSVMRRLSQKRIPDRELGYWRREQPAGSGPAGAKAPAAARRPRHVLVAGAAGSGLHRAGRAGWHVLVPGDGAENRSGAVLRCARRAARRRRPAGLPGSPAAAARGLAREFRAARRHRCRTHIDRRLSDTRRHVRQPHPEQCRRAEADRVVWQRPVPDGRAERRRNLLGDLSGWRELPSGLDDAARRPDGPSPDRDNRGRQSRRVPYAGGGYTIAAAAPRAIGDQWTPRKLISPAGPRHHSPPRASRTTSTARAKDPAWC